MHHTHTTKPRALASRIQAALANLPGGRASAYWKRPLPVSSMPDTYGRLASMAEKGAMTSPSYGLMTPVSAGTEPGTLASEMKPKRPSTG
mgnify:CR=1 FL=1|jgi:hypothetical protein